MSLDTDNLAERFSRVFDTAEPPTGVDPQSLLEAGHRIKRHRRKRRQFVGSTAGLVCVLVAGAFVLASPRPAGPDTSTIEIGDPLTIQADFTSLPGPTLWTTYAGTTAQESGSVDREWTYGKVAVDERLVWQVSSMPSPSKLKSVGTVNGQAAYFADGALYFKSPTGHWAELSGIAFPSDKTGVDDTYLPVSVELEIARAVHFASRAIALPIRIADPAVKPWLITFTTQGADKWSLQLRYSEGSTDAELDVKPGAPDPVGKAAGLNYYVATHTFKGASKASNGVGINIEMATPNGSASADPRGYLTRITSLGLDPADWTTRPIVG